MTPARVTGARGGTTVVMLAVLVVGMVCMLGAARMGAALLARARADAAADAAALAAADALALGAGSSTARADAAATAADNGARLAECDCAGPRVTVTVVVDAPALGRVARGRASAEVDGPGVPQP
ncbi:MAG: Rv3654c family TadE-like protein [Actinomycetota bacterium]